MTYTEIEAQARQLSLEEQMRLVENLLHTIRERLAPAETEESDEERRRRLASIPPGSAMLGAIRTE